MKNTREIVNNIFMASLNIIINLFRVLLKNHLFVKIFIFIIFPIGQLFIIELLNKQNLSETITWFYSSPVELFINYIIILCIFLMNTAVLGRVAISVPISLFVLTVFPLVSSQKKLFLGEPLFPWDLVLFRYAVDLIPNLNLKFNYFNFLLIILSIAFMVLLYFVFKKYYLPVKYRVVFGILSFSMIGILILNPYVINIVLPKIGVSNMDWVQSENYNKNGFTLAFMMNMKNIMILKPHNYNEKTLTSKVKAIENYKIGKEGEAFKHPNVIMVMSEAFWDPTLMKNVSFSSDPIPTVRSLMKESSSGHLLSPTYGGGTSNVEFEVLTGNSMSFFPDGANPYQQYIKKPTPSLASIFANQGYNSMAIHSYHKWFFNRDKIYDLIGFQKFIGIEDFKNPEYKGFYISDKEVSKMIINEHKNSDNPVFIYAITMQNHGPYDTKRYENTEIKVKCDGLTKQGKSILEDYTQGAHDADRSLKLLIDYFEKVEEPTVIVFFGDHLPMLGNNFSVYYETGYVKSPDAKWTNEEYRDLHSTPLLIWTNYPSKKSNLNVISASYLGAYLMDFINMEKPLYFEFLNYAYNNMPVNLKYLKMDSNDFLYSKSTSQLKELETTYWAFQYDILFGKGYVSKPLFDNKR